MQGALRGRAVLCIFSRQGARFALLSAENIAVDFLVYGAVFRFFGARHTVDFRDNRHGFSRLLVIHYAFSSPYFPFCFIFGRIYKKMQNFFTKIKTFLLTLTFSADIILMYINVIMPILTIKEGNYSDMKKILAVLISVAMLFCMCIPAFAGENVDALSDEQQKEIATLILSAIDEGKDVDSISGRTQIRSGVINGITDYSALEELYNSDPEALRSFIKEAVEAAKADGSFSDKSASMLTADIFAGIKNKVAPTETTTVPTETTTEESTETIRDNIDSIITVVQALPFDQMKDVIVALIGNGVINKTEAQYIAKQLLNDGKITADQYAQLIAAINSDEAGKSILDKIFEGYTPADLSQLFRGFGDAISTMATAIANLLRSGADGSDDNKNGGKDGTNPSNPSIPATGDYTVTTVATVALLAGAAFILTRKRTNDDK